MVPGSAGVVTPPLGTCHDSSAKNNTAESRDVSPYLAQPHHCPLSLPEVTNPKLENTRCIKRFLKLFETLRVYVCNKKKKKGEEQVLAI